MMKREIFKPPPVLPAQAPVNIKRIKMVFENDGHKLKSAVANPVVVTMEHTWNAAIRKVSDMESLNFKILYAMNTVLSKISATYQRTSSMENADLNFFFKIK